MSVVTCGATLVKKLAETGTGANKLDPCRQKLRAIHLRDNGRIATAAEMVEVLLETGAPQGTLTKAQTIIKTGEWRGPANEIEVPIEVQLLGDDAVIEWKSDIEKKRDEAVAKNEPNLPTQPGVHPTNLQGEENVVGPKRVKK